MNKALVIVFLTIILAQVYSPLVSIASTNASPSPSSGRLVVSYVFEGRAFLLNERGEVPVVKIRLLSDEPFGVTRINDIIFYVNCTYPVEKPVIFEYNSDDYLLSTECYLKLPVIWKLEGRVEVYNESSGAYRIIVRAKLDNYYNLKAPFKFKSLVGNITLMRIVGEDAYYYDLLIGTNMTIVIEAKGMKVLVNGTPSTFNPFFPTYPITAREAAELVEENRKLYYLGVPIEVSPWSDRREGDPQEWLTAYADIPLGRPYEGLMGRDLGADRVYFISPLYKGTPFKSYIILNVPPTLKALKEVVEAANTSTRYGESVAPNYMPPLPSAFEGVGPLDVVVMYKRHYPVRLLYVPVPMPRGMEKIGSMLVFCVFKMHYEYPPDFDLSKIDIGPVPRPRSESSVEKQVLALVVVGAGVLVVVLMSLYRRRGGGRGEEAYSL